MQARMVGGLEGEGPRGEPTALQAKQPEQMQPLQGRAEGRQSLQGPTTFDGHEPDAWRTIPIHQSMDESPVIEKRRSHQKHYRRTEREQKQAEEYRGLMESWYHPFEQNQLQGPKRRYTLRTRGQRLRRTRLEVEQDKAFNRQRRDWVRRGLPPSKDEHKGEETASTQAQETQPLSLWERQDIRDAEMKRRRYPSTWELLRQLDEEEIRAEERRARRKRREQR